MKTKQASGFPGTIIKTIWLCPISCLAAQAFATMALAGPVSGTLVGWAENTNYLAGMPAGLSNVVAVSASASQNYYSQNIVLKNNGTVIAWGRNGAGQLETNVPAGLSNVIAIAAGADHYLALKSDSTVVSWEGNVNYAIPASVSNVVAIAAGDGASLALRKDGTLVGWTSGGISSLPVGATNNVVAIAAENDTYLALKTDGTVVAWGLDNVGQTEVPKGLTNVTAIAIDYTHSLALKNDGTVVSWGVNWDGQTNVPAALNNVVAVAAGGIKGSHSLVLKSDGTVVSWGAGLTNVPAGLRNVVAVAAGDYYNLAITVNLQLTAIRRGAQNRSFSFNSSSGQQYSVEYATGLAPGTWLALPGGNITGTGEQIEVTDTNTTGTARFYRVRLVP